MNPFQSIRNSDTCVICGNGPSLICEEVFSGNNDIFMINTGIFLSVKPTLYFYERIGMRSGDTTHAYGVKNYLEDNFDFEAILRIIFYEMGITASKALESKNLFINPNPELDGFINPILNNCGGIDCNIFSFNEKCIDLYGHSLLFYFRNLLYSHVLNFRGSIIRAYSVALSLGYQSIIFAGIDPSEYRWWWENESAWPFLRPSVVHLQNHFSAISRLRPSHLVRYDSEIGEWLSAPMSWCLRKTILASKRSFEERAISFPRITMIGNDPIAYSIFS